MRTLVCMSLLVLNFSVFARDPGSGSNTTVGPGPVTPDAGSSDTSVMGGGTPGNQGINTLDINEPDEKWLKRKEQRQEEIKREKKKRQREMNQGSKIGD